jgi:hypothetical protein
VQRYFNRAELLHEEKMLACASTRLSPPKPARDGVKAPGDLLHFLVRAAIQATPPGSMRMMSAGLMVELLVEQGLAQHQAKRWANHGYLHKFICCLCYWCDISLNAVAVDLLKSPSILH